MTVRNEIAKEYTPMDRTLSYTIEERFSGMDVKGFLKAMNYSSQCISDQKHVHDGIMHNGQRAYVTEKISTGDNITINIHEENSSEKIPPVFMELDILYEDEDLIILNKPEDMPVHPSMNNYENTLANGLAYYYESQGERFVFRCMNRLDRNTTGAVLVAKNSLSGAMLSELVRERKIKKEYVAAVEGAISADNLKNEHNILMNHNSDSFTIDAPIGRVDGSTIERCIDEEKGERAVTHVTIIGIAEDRQYSVVSCELETGRTHQIRVHMSHIGHPLVGDGLYNPKYKDNVLHRQLLHCRSLEFTHPISGEKISVVADFPNDMKIAEKLFDKNA